MTASHPSTGHHFFLRPFCPSTLLGPHASWWRAKDTYFSTSPSSMSLGTCIRRVYRDRCSLKKEHVPMTHRLFRFFPRGTFGPACSEGPGSSSKLSEWPAGGSWLLGGVFDVEGTGAGSSSLSKVQCSCFNRSQMWLIVSSLTNLAQTRQYLSLSNQNLKCSANLVPVRTSVHLRRRNK